MSASTIEKLNKILNKKGMRPTRVTRHVDGRSAFVWHVDDCDDRYVLLQDSVESEDLLVLVRDRRAVSAVVMEKVEEAVLLVEGELTLLAKNKTARLVSG